MPRIAAACLLTLVLTAAGAASAATLPPPDPWPGQGRWVLAENKMPVLPEAALSAPGRPGAPSGILRARRAVAGFHAGLPLFPVRQLFEDAAPPAPAPPVTQVPLPAGFWLLGGALALAGLAGRGQSASAIPSARSRARRAR